MKLWQSYRLRLKRRRYKIRAFRKSFALKEHRNRTSKIRSGDILLFCTLRNENIRLSYFLDYYRKLGVSHFLIVDNNSTDGSTEFLEDQKDVSLWHTTASYRRSRFGVDWLNWLQSRYGHNHWTLVVDPDELFVYPFCDTRPIKALTDWLDGSRVRSFGTIMLDMYPKGRINDQTYKRGQNPLDIASWFDPGNYTVEKNHLFGNLWIQGGPRSRTFFKETPKKAPALNKIPLVKWHRKYAYVSSTHMLLPRGLNLVYDEWGGETASGALLHAKFLNTFSEKAIEELKRNQHYKKGDEYQQYLQNEEEIPELWCKWSEKYINWRQLELLGLMSKGNWA